MPHSSPESRPHPNRSLLILSIAALAFALAQTTLIPALGDLKERLDTDASGVAWTLTGYLIAAAVFTPLFGRLGDMFGKRRMLVVSLLLFAAGSVVSAIGGALVDHASYHWIFWLGAAMAVVAAVAIELFIPESPVRTKGRIDLRGAAVLGVGLVLPMVAISRANDWGWGSSRTILMVLVGLVILAGWVVLQRRTEQPL